MLLWARWFCDAVVQHNVNSNEEIWWQGGLGNPGPGSTVEKYGLGNGMDLGARWELGGSEHGGLGKAVDLDMVDLDTMDLGTRWIWVELRPRRHGTLNNTVS